MREGEKEREGERMRENMRTRNLSTTDESKRENTLRDYDLSKLSSYFIYYIEGQNNPAKLLTNSKITINYTK